MRILACDDNAAILAQIKKYIKDFYTGNHLTLPDLAFFESGEDLLADTGPKDIVFLDVEMPGVSGIYTGAELKKQNPNVLIFIITSYAEYLDEAMRINVFRYLSKPIEKERLFRNLADALRIYHSKSSTLAIETRDGIYTISTTQLIFVEAQGRKVLLHTTSGTYESIHSMQYWVLHLPENTFYQTHRSFIVNLQYVNNFDHSLIYLYEQKYTAYLTRRKYSEFKNLYLCYIEASR